MLFITLKAHNHAGGKYRLIIHEYYFVLVHKQECIREWCYRYPMGNHFMLTQQLILYAGMCFSDNSWSKGILSPSKNLHK